MKAQILRDQRPIEANPLSFEDISIPKPSSNQVLIKISTCGVCLTDRHIIEGDLAMKMTPTIVGHQIVGIIEKLGEEVRGWKVGDRVGVPWLHHTCGRCDYCIHQHENLCERATFTGYDVPGGYAEYTTARSDFLVEIPISMSDIEAAPLLCAGIVGYRSYKLSEIQPGEHLGLFGFGASAHIVIQIAKYHGCEVSVFTRDEIHQKLALELGASFSKSVEDKPLKPLDSAIIFAPAGEIVPYALSYLRRGGTLAVNAICASNIPELDYGVLYHEHTLRSVTNATRQDASEFLTLAAKIPIKTKVTTYSLRDANRALRDLKESKISGSAVFTM